MIKNPVQQAVPAAIHQQVHVPIVPADTTFPAGHASPVPPFPSVTVHAPTAWATKIMSLAKAQNATQGTGTNTEHANLAVMP